MPRLSIIALLGASVALNACTSMGRMARVDPVSVVNQKHAKCALIQGIDGGEPYALDLDCYTFPGEEDSKKAYALATTSDTERNRLEAVLLRQADSICELEKGQIFANEAMINSALDFISTSLSTTSTIVGGEQAKSILAGLAGISTATRSNITANVYKNQIVPAITNVMDAERKRILTEMAARHTEKVTIYPADEMIRLANSYHQACSFQNGIQLLLKASINKAGSDAIIKAINLRNGIENLKGNLTAYKSMNAANLGNAEVAAKIKSMDDKLVQMALEFTENAQAIESATITADTPGGGS
jgi:hypothetical protein